MTAFLTEVGTKLADRWLSILLIPGLLWTGVLVAAILLGDPHALDAHRLLIRIPADAADIQKHGTTAVIAAALIAALVASGAGLAVSLIRAILQRIALGQWWPHPIAAWRQSRRANAWRKAADGYSTAVEQGQDAATLARLAAKRNRIGLAPPSNPTWMGDRMAAIETRVYIEYGLDLPSAWPRLWLIAPDQARSEITTAGTALDGALGLGGWAVLYLVVLPLWWPASVIVVACAATGWIRARSAVGVMADLVEATVDLYGADLAVDLGLVNAPAKLTQPLGREITRLLRKGA